LEAQFEEDKAPRDKDSFTVEESKGGLDPSLEEVTRTRRQLEEPNPNSHLKPGSNSNPRVKALTELLSYPSRDLNTPFTMLSPVIEGL